MKNLKKIDSSSIRIYSVYQLMKTCTVSINSYYLYSKPISKFSIHQLMPTCTISRKFYYLHRNCIFEHFQFIKWRKPEQYQAIRIIRRAKPILKIEQSIGNLSNLSIFINFMWWRPAEWMLVEQMKHVSRHQSHQIKSSDAKCFNQEQKLLGNWQ